MRYFIHLFSITLLAASLPATARSSATAQQRPAIDVVIAMDVSGSMSNLIDSAKQRLWDVVNTFSRAQPQPELRVAIVSYGNPGYGSDSGYVRIDQQLTSDLDSVNETLFAFTTNGGDEYVARAVSTSIEQLDWNRSDDAMRIIFVAGNESAEQDPALALSDVLARAIENDIIVNAIYCGSEGDSIAAAWRGLAFNTQGTFAAIDQAANVVAQIETPVDSRLAELAKELNNTYIPYGEKGQESKDRQAQQDDNASEMSIGALASRAVTKASALYQSVKWDLVDAFEQGQALDEIDSDMLPAPMQNMPIAEVEQVVEEQSRRRDELKKEIAELDTERREYVEDYRAKTGADGFGAALSEALTEQAEEHGFEVN